MDFSLYNKKFNDFCQKQRKISKFANYWFMIMSTYRMESKRK